MSLVAKAVETWERLGFAPITADTQTTATPSPVATGRIPQGPNLSGSPKSASPLPSSEPLEKSPVKEQPVTDVSDTFVDTMPKTVKVPSPVPAQTESTLHDSYRAVEQAVSFDDLMRRGRG